MSNEELSAGAVDLDARARLVKISQEPFNPRAPQGENIAVQEVGHNPGQQVLPLGALSDQQHATTATNIVLPFNPYAPNATGNHPGPETIPLLHPHLREIPVDLDALRGTVSIDEEAKREPANLPPAQWYPSGNA